MSFSQAIVRAPSRSFTEALTSGREGLPDAAAALRQHAHYVQALRDCGLRITSLEPDEEYPDGTFVEDTAIVTSRGAILTRPGAPSRAGEVPAIAECLREFRAELPAIAAPGTLDGGDVCEADGHFLIGVSGRTNEHGAGELAAHLARWDYSSSIIDIRSNPALLHLKSGIAYLGDGAWIADPSIEGELRAALGTKVRDLICVSAAEAYAANCVRVNDAVLIPEGYPDIRSALRSRGYRLAALQMSEFRKMDGGLSCLSLRF